MTLGELRGAIASKAATGRSSAIEEVEFHRKFSLPFACLVFGLVGVPLGLQPVRALKSRSFSVSLALIFLYYLLLTAGEAMAKKGAVPPILGLWLPNVVFAALGMALFSSAAREVPLTFGRNVRRTLVARWARRQPA
jgi:lipopolysaccharide export LptBFGC system permease protein LptF